MRKCILLLELVSLVTITLTSFGKFYTAFFSLYPWKGLEDTHKFTHFQGKPCRVQICVLSYNKEEFSSSDVVIFHGRNLPSVNKLRQLHSKRLRIKPGCFFFSKAQLTALIPVNMKGCLTGL